MIGNSYIKLQGVSSVQVDKERMNSHEGQNGSGLKNKYDFYCWKMGRSLG